MEAIFAKIAQETSTFAAGDEEKWRELYEPQYPEPPSDVTVIRDERYGPAERNRLDVFIPPGEEEGRIVMMYIHGGGFYSGDKGWTPKVYSNIGWFFAQRGIITVVINHQLVPDVQYPGGADDIQLAREWIYENISAPKFGRGSVDNVFLFGHSSGGAHVAMNLYAGGDAGRPTKNPLFPPVAGVMYLDVPFWYDRRKPVRQKVIRSYYGSDAEETWGPKSALGLFKALPEDSPALDSRNIPVYLGSVEWEVPETIDATMLFFNAYRERSKPSGTLPTFHILKKHNHLSNVLSIGTEDTAQGDHLLEFMRSCVADKKLSSRLTPN
ncbi:alpha/beta-hydrolase [Aspergillus varians]